MNETSQAIEMLRRDLVILQNMGYATRPAWGFDGLGMVSWIKITDAFALVGERFNQETCSILVPVPSSIYQPVPGTDRFHFYEYLYIDDSLRIRDGWNVGWRRPARSYQHNLKTSDGIPARSGWQWLCVMHPTCASGDNILTLIAAVQTYIYNEA